MRTLSALLFCLTATWLQAQQPQQEKVFTRADTLRGSINPERAWWDVQRYDITVKPDFTTKTTAGSCMITYKVVSDNQPAMQLDLQEPLHIDSISYNGAAKLPFTREGHAWHIQTSKQKKGESNRVTVYFSGTPKEGTRPPWVGGWTWAKDSLGRPWITVTCQGLGASVWFPCKDHQSDEPDQGASLAMTVPDTLVAVANGRMQSKKNNGDGTATFKWAVVNPISTYCIIPYIGKYVNFKEVYKGEKGNLDVNYWVLDYNLERAKSYFPLEITNMLKAFEHWMGPYPFYEDGFQLIDVQHTGMEHQSAVAYGNLYKGGYRGRDGSGTGIGLKWDFIIVHESGHEWFGNNITSKDLADMYIHEGFTNYSETMYVDYIWGKEAANAYNFGIRRGIRNDRPIIAKYNVNDQGSGDMYPKASNMIHSIRHSIDNDSLFRQIIRGLNKTFYHQTVTTPQIVQYISTRAGFNYTNVFDQYLRNVQIPQLQFYFGDDNQKAYYRWTNCIPGFDLPLVLKKGEATKKIFPTSEWKSSDLKMGETALFDTAIIRKGYYITVMPVKNPARLSLKSPAVPYEEKKVAGRYEGKLRSSDEDEQ